jgi:F-type H+-transporting ATPase subunit a
MQVLGITHFFNLVFGPVFAWLMQLVGMQPMRPNAPINDAFALEMLVAFGLIAFFILVRVTLSVENPGPVQHVAEMVHDFVGGMGDQVIGHGYERFQSFATCVLLFVLFNNLIGLLGGLIPGVVTPTGQPVVPLGVALMTFIYYNFHGLREQGLVKYIKHFMGPLPALAPLMFPIEIVSHLARVMSLTIRLYANMFASDLLMLVWFSLIPLAVPAVFLGLHFVVSIIQAFVFMLLTMIYLSMAVAHDH